jgi:hypothetical protein
MFQAFVGDRSTKEGLSLLHTMHVVFLEPSANATMQTQAEARVLRLCALKGFPFERWSKVQLWRMISIPPGSGRDDDDEDADRPARGRRRAPRLGGFVQTGKRMGPARGRHHEPRLGGFAMGNPSDLDRPGFSVANFGGFGRVAKTPSASSSRLGGFGRVAKTPSASSSRLPRRTNEEWQYVYLQGQKPASTTILDELKNIAIDRLLFQNYNGLTKRLIDDRQSQMKPRYDRFCSTSANLLLQDEMDPQLVEFTEDGMINPEGVRASDVFERSCSLAKASVVTFNGVGYRDLLVLEALKAPATPTPSASDNFIIRQILQLLAQPSQVQQWSLEQDLKLWMLVSSLPETSRHREALERFLQHRIMRLTDDQQQRVLLGMVEQITTWMRKRLQVDFAVQALQEFFKRLPTLQTLFSRPPVAPRVMLPPSAPPLSSLVGGGGYGRGGRGGGGGQWVRYRHRSMVRLHPFFHRYPVS